MIIVSLANLFKELFNQTINRQICHTIRDLVDFKISKPRDNLSL